MDRRQQEAFINGVVMHVLVTGATGFIGGHLRAALESAGHTVRCASRRRPRGCADWVAADFTVDHDPAAWLPRLDGVDAVINAVGILRARGAQDFAALHVAAPRALFAACAQAGVGRVLQVSALGADAQAASAYHRSKRDADDFLLSLDLCATVIQPSLVFGPDGTSSRWLLAIAALPVLALPSDAGAVQPIHVEDLVRALLRLLQHRSHCNERIALVGPRALPFADYLQVLRGGLGLRPAALLQVPSRLARIGAKLAAWRPASLVDPEALEMLARGNQAEVATTSQLLGCTPRDPQDFIPARQADDLLRAARLSVLLPVLRVSLAALWIWTGIVSLGLYPTADSYALLARTGFHGGPATIALYGAALLDLGLGLALLVGWHRRAVLLAQIALIAGYTVLISFWLPEFWLHPYGPVAKNLPLLAATLLLHQLEPR